MVEPPVDPQPPPPAPPLPPGEAPQPQQVVAAASPAETSQAVSLAKQIGPGLFVVLVIVYMLFDYLKGQDVEAPEFTEALAQITELAAAVEVIGHRTSEMHKWHAVEDDKGVKMMYGRSLSPEMETQTGLLRDLVAATKEQTGTLERMEARLAN